MFILRVEGLSTFIRRRTANRPDVRQIAHRDATPSLRRLRLSIRRAARRDEPDTRRNHTPTGTATNTAPSTNSRIPNAECRPAQPNHTNNAPRPIDQRAARAHVQPRIMTHPQGVPGAPPAWHPRHTRPCAGC